MNRSSHCVEGQPGKLEKSMLSGFLYAIETDAFWTPF